MFFKNLTVYKLQESFLNKTSLEDLENFEEKLKENCTRELGALEVSHIGWTKPLGDCGTLYSHVSTDCIMLTLQKLEKIIPNASLNRLVDKEVSRLDKEEDRNIPKSERLTIKEDIYASLLPKAIVKSTKIQAYLDFKTNLVFINTSSNPRAEEFLNLLRETVGNLKIVPFSLDIDLSAVMTAWIKQPATMPSIFCVGNECELINGMDNNTVKYKNQDLFTEELQSHFEEGKVVIKLQVMYNDSITFSLSNEMILTKISFTDELIDSIDQSSEEYVDIFDADLVLMSSQFRDLFVSLQSNLINCLPVDRTLSTVASYQS